MDTIKYITESVLINLDWFFLLCSSFFVYFTFFLALSRFGKIKLGRPEDRPEFSTLSWLAMLFAGGVGTALMFWGVAEPLLHFMIPPPETADNVADKARRAILSANLHWAFHGWSIYCIAALTVAYFGYRKNVSILISGPILHVFQGKIAIFIARIADIVAVVAVAFGIAGSVGLGILLINTGVSRVYGTESGSLWVSMGLLIMVMIASMLSSLTGLNKGIKYLSNLNLLMAI